VRRLVAFLPLAALLALVALFGGWSLWRSSEVVPEAMVGKPLPALTIARLSGGAPAGLRLMARGPALVNFYASWCAPCVQEAPALLALKAEGVKIIGVAYKDDPAQAKAFLARLGDPYAEDLADPDGRVGLEFGVTGPPETYAIDARGVIRAKRVGAIDAAAADDLVAAARR